MRLQIPGMTSDKVPQILAVLAATISAISDGMQYGWAAPVVPVLQAPDSPIQIDEEDIVWLESIYMIGGIIGLPVTIYCVDKFGRKKSILLASCNTLVAWIMMATTNSVPVLLVARILTGLAGDVAFVATPMYIAEIADQSIRGSLGSLIYIMMLLGILVIYCVAPFVSLMVSSLVGVAIILVQLVIFPFMPESPYFLLMKGKPEDAKKALTKFRNNSNVDKEFEEIAQAMERQNKEKGRFIDLIKVKSNLKGITIMTVLNAAQHFSSISVMLMNLHTILADAGAILAPSTAGILFSVMMLLAASLAGILVDKAGRKVLLATSSILTGMSLGVLATYFAIKNADVDVSAYNWVPVAAVMIYAIVFKFGLGLIPIVLTAELFPASVKAKGMTIADAMYVFFGAISIYLYQYMATTFGLHAPFFLFAASCILTALYAVFFIPETKGKTLEEIQFLLKGEKIELKETPSPCRTREMSPQSETSMMEPHELEDETDKLKDRSRESTPGSDASGDSETPALTKPLKTVITKNV